MFRRMRKKDDGEGTEEVVGIDARNHAYLTLERGRRDSREDEGSHHEEFRGSHVKLSNV